MPENVKTTISQTMEWLVRGLLAIMFWLHTDTGNKIDNLADQIEKQQVTLQQTQAFIAKGERFTQQDGKLLKLSIENYIKDNVPPPEVKKRLDKMEDENRALKEQLTEIRINMLQRQAHIEK